MDFSAIQSSDSDIYNLILLEQIRQSDGMEFVASENYQSKAVLQAQSSVFANKYSEGTP
jgi:glycine hydroxymethyltransferase